MSPGQKGREVDFADAQIRRVARRLNLEVASSTVVGPLWGTVAAIALWRFAVQRGALWASIALAGVGIAVSYVLIRKRMVTYERAAVIADRYANAGGLLFTHLEADIGSWTGALRAAIARMALPPMRVGRPLLAIAGGGVFLVVVLWLPVPGLGPRPVNAAAAARVEEVARVLDAVAKEVPVEPEVRHELDRLRQELKQGSFDATDWEAADSLAQEGERKAEEAFSRLLKAEEAAAELDQALESGRTLERLDREREDLERALMELSGGRAEDANLFPNSQPGVDEGNPPSSGRQEDVSGPSASPGSSPRQRAAEATHGQQESLLPSGRGLASDVRPSNAVSDGRPPAANGGSEAANRGQGSDRGVPSDGRPRGQEPGRNEQSDDAQDGNRGSAANHRAGGPTRAQLEELRRALQQRRAELSRSVGHSGGGAARLASRPRPSGRNQKNGNVTSHPGKSPDDGQSSAGVNDRSDAKRGEDGSGSETTARTARVAAGPHASRLMQGAPDHGPAAATELVFGGQAEMDPARLRPKPLPEGNGGDGTELLGLVAANPMRLVAGRSPGGSGSGSGSAAQGEELPANRESSYLPRNRALIQRYFDAPKASRP